MKIVHTKIRVDIQELKDFLKREIDPQFKERRHADIDFVYTLSGNSVQITQPNLYQDFLFRIDAVSDTELHITKSEHYTDDVNVLTLEDILNTLLLEYPGRENIDFIGEES
jgi:hypothetical protein